jgi:3-isopropylmalate dehydrogenase
VRTEETHRIVLLPGDGIGPEVTAAAETVMRTARDHLRLQGVQLEWEHRPIGGTAIDAQGCPLPQETRAAAQASSAELLGAVGGPKWDHLPAAERPEAGLLGIRRALSVYANLRPAQLLPGLEGRSPLRAGGGVDILLVRELTGGIYFGEPRHLTGEGQARRAVDTMAYAEGAYDRWRFEGRVAGGTLWLDLRLLHHVKQRR